MTYAKMMVGEDFDWNKFLSKEPKEYTKDELDQARIKSASWVTCACGNQCSTIPRNILGMPKDIELTILGSGFHSYIVDVAEKRSDNWAEAKKVLAKIEQRSAEILNVSSKNV